MVVDWANSRQFLAIADFIELTLKSSQCHAAGQRTWISSPRGRRYLESRALPRDFRSSQRDLRRAKIARRCGSTMRISPPPPFRSAVSFFSGTSRDKDRRCRTEVPPRTAHLHILLHSYEDRGRRQRARGANWTSHEAIAVCIFAATAVIRPLSSFNTSI